jgi:hypothetical protein
VNQQHARHQRVGAVDARVLAERGIERRESVDEVAVVLRDRLQLPRRRGEGAGRCIRPGVQQEKSVDLWQLGARLIEGDETRRRQRGKTGALQRRTH